MGEDNREQSASPVPQEQVPYFWESSNNGYIKLEGIFKGTKIIKTSPRGFDAFVTREFGFNDEELEIIEDCNNAANELRPFIHKMVHDRKTVQALMKAEDADSFDFVGVLGLPQDQEERMRTMMSTGIDIDLIPLLSIKETRTEFALSLGGGILLDSLTYDEETYNQFRGLVLDDELSVQSNSMKPLEGPTLNKVEAFINRALEAYQQDGRKLDYAAEKEARLQLGNFFTSENDPHAPGFMDYCKDLRKITADMYGEHTTSVDTFKGFSFRTDKDEYPDFNFYFGTLRRYAFDREKMAYFRSIAANAESAVRDTLPEIYEHNLVEHMAIVPTKLDETENGRYVNKTVYLIVDELPDVTDYKDLADAECEFWTNTVVKRRVSDTITYIHEWAHARREQVDVNKMRASYYDKSNATGAIEEGFAVMVEYLAIKRAIKEPAAFGLEESDRADLIMARKGRTEYLKDSLDHYTEGVLHILGRVYGEGVRTEHTEEGGIRAMMRFIDQIDMEKASFLMRSMDEYKQIIESRKTMDEIIQIINAS